MHFPAVSFLAITVGILCSPAALPGAQVSATDPLLRYVGRFDTTEGGSQRASWSASSVAINVSGGNVSARLKDGGRNQWQILVNGEPTQVLILENGEQTYPIATGLAQGENRIELVKRTEASIGATEILGFEIDDAATLLPVAQRQRRIEVIGDSISCGYGNEAASKEEKFTPATQNAWNTYGAIAARDVNADYVCIAWSGKRLWPGNSIIDLYDRTAPNVSQARWDFSTQQPDAVVINLGTNEFNAQANPEEAGWVGAYVDFIRQIRSHYPNAVIYCAVGPMLSNWPGDRKPRSTILGYLEQVVAQANATGGPPVRLLDFGTQAQHHGIGAQWHPSVTTHTIMGRKLAQALRDDLNW